MLRYPFLYGCIFPAAAAVPAPKNHKHKKQVEFYEFNLLGGCGGRI